MSTFRNCRCWPKCICEPPGNQSRLLEVAVEALRAYSTQPAIGALKQIEEGVL